MILESLKSITVVVSEWVSINGVRAATSGGEEYEGCNDGSELAVVTFHRDR